MDFQTLAQQLSKPEGEAGKELAALMHESNFSMSKHAIDLLQIEDNQQILEIGHGNCGHLPYLLGKNNSISYYGLEISELMHSESKKSFTEKLQNHSIKFDLYDGVSFPYSNLKFDRIFTVNTIYFWKNPQQVFSEFQQHLTQDGLLNITFGLKSYMEKLPFTQFGFTLYDLELFEKLISITPFKMLNQECISEDIISKTGEKIRRDFATISLGLI